MCFAPCSCSAIHSIAMLYRECIVFIFDPSGQAMYMYSLTEKSDVEVVGLSGNLPWRGTLKASSVFC
ncbi:hypothetical protein EMPS_06697 [Entomortierella parvispora]|uniref:Uncharacterized protein n=1 Tax=Entomortierella parvispora TaxID=205924 RepID=A0A9P3HCV4_9FUNG|nr:hypothetical protein EMPS_06697 [Entomortierella parvispora]